MMSMKSPGRSHKYQTPVHSCQVPRAHSYNDVCKGNFKRFLLWVDRLVRSNSLIFGELEAVGK